MFVKNDTQMSFKHRISLDISSQIAHDNNLSFFSKIAFSKRTQFQGLEKLLFLNLLIFYNIFFHSSFHHQNVVMVIWKKERLAIVALKKYYLFCLFSNFQSHLI